MYSKRTVIMNCGLVVVDQTEAHRDLLREAAEHASGTDAEIVLLTLMSEERYESDIETLESIGSVENVSYDSSAVLDAAANETSDTAREILPDDVGFKSIAKAIDDDERAHAVLDTATNQDCDHIYVLGRHRSPTGKALFGDVAQQIVLNFDGYVTLSTN